MNKVIASLILVLMTAPLGAQVPADVPKLVVGITIDQLRTDYLQMMRHVFGDKGFKRLMDEGLLYDQVTFDFPNIDRSSATASIYTGTYPLIMELWPIHYIMLGRIGWNLSCMILLKWEIIRMKRFLLRIC